MIMPNINAVWVGNRRMNALSHPSFVSDNLFIESVSTPFHC
jgi:hypothetical protein